MNNNITKYIANKIKYYRELNNITQQELAELLNTTQQTIARYENAERKAGNDILFTLADYFGISINNFFPDVNVKFGTETENIIQKVSKELNIPVTITKNIFLDLNLSDSTNLTYNNVKKEIQKWLHEKNNEIETESCSNELDQILFSKVKDLSEEDKKAVLGVINAIHKDVDKELDN